MKAHPLDLVALGFGLVFTLFAVLFLADAAAVVSYDGPTAVGGILVTVGVVAATVTLLRAGSVDAVDGGAGEAEVAEPLDAPESVGSADSTDAF